MTAGLERMEGIAAGDGPAADGSVAEQDGSVAEQGGEVPGARESAAGVLADRMAAAFLHREPGWKLPRRSALARRFSVSIAEIDVAVEELSRRSLLRKLPDGQLYRASPAEYRIPIEGVPGLAASLDPMGSDISCRARHVSQRPAPQDISWALGLAPGTQVRVIRCLWTSGGTPAAISTAYLPHSPAAPQQRPGALSEAQAADTDWIPAFDAVLSAPPPSEQDSLGGADIVAAAGRPAALHVEMRPPQPSVARGLHLGPGQPVITVTMRFDDSSTPVALTVVMLRPDLFKVSIETAPPRAT